MGSFYKYRHDNPLISWYSKLMGEKKKGFHRHEYFCIYRIRTFIWYKDVSFPRIFVVTSDGKSQRLGYIGDYPIKSEIQ